MLGGTESIRSDLFVCDLCVQPIDHNHKGNGHVESSEPERKINTTSDSTAEQVFLFYTSEVTSHGPGLSKGFLGKKTNFT